MINDWLITPSTATAMGNSIKNAAGSGIVDGEYDADPTAKGNRVLVD